MVITLACHAKVPGSIPGNSVKTCAAMHLRGKVNPLHYELECFLYVFISSAFIKIYACLVFMCCLGRLVMHLICNQETVGSIPTGSL